MNETHFGMYLAKFNKHMLFDFFKEISEYDKNPNCSIRSEPFREKVNADMINKMVINGHINLNQETIDTIAITFLHLYHLWKDRNYFTATKPLIERITATDISNVNTKYIVCPYRSMYVTLPALKIINIDGYFITGLYINYYEYEEPMPFKLRDGDTIFMEKFLYFMGISKDNPMWALQRSFILGDKTINSAFNYNKDVFNGAGEEYIVDFCDELVLKLLLYINCSNLNIRNVVGVEYPNSILTIPEAKKRKRAMREYKMVYGGAQKIIDVPIEDHYSISEDQKNIKHYKLKTPHKVRGHFRQQPYGKNRENVKTIWIMPYIKGDLNLGFNNTRKYKVG